MISDYGIDQDFNTMLCKNTSAINRSKNPFNILEPNIFDIKHHFSFRDLVKRNVVILEHIHKDSWLICLPSL